ncbi:Putative phytosulfokines 6 [Linum grandiflorum]
MNTKAPLLSLSLPLPVVIIIILLFPSPNNKLEKMGRTHYSTLLLLAFLLVSSFSSASSQGADGKISVDEKAGVELAFGSSLASLDEDFSMLMGEGGVVCEEKDEDCLKRRMMAEAHLDYIYTQSHKHP